MCGLRTRQEEYERARSGAVSTFEASSLEELATVGRSLRDRPVSERGATSPWIRSSLVKTARCTARGGLHPGWGAMRLAVAWYPVASDGDDDLSSGVAGPDVAEGLGRLAQRVGAVDDRLESPCLEKAGQLKQVLALLD